ncbi:MAG: hypothetical protein ACXV3D_06705 [Halobacteriota archaeon]
MNTQEGARKRTHTPPPAASSINMHAITHTVESELSSALTNEKLNEKTLEDIEVPYLRIVGDLKKRSTEQQIGEAIARAIQERLEAEYDLTDGG